MSNLKSSDFVHLHNHTHYSVLDGLTKVDELVNKTKEFGMNAVAVTDHGTMTGILDFYKTAKDQGIKPILGMEAYVAARGRGDKDPQFDKKRFHVTLIAKSYKGYQNLMQLSSKANLEGYYYKPRIDHEIMEKFSEDIVCMSGCASGEISMKLRNDDYQGAKKLAEWYYSVYKNNFYLELQDHGHPKSPAPWKEQTKINEGLIKLSRELNLPMVVTCDGHYLNHQDRQVHEILLCVGTGAYLSDPGRMSLKEFELHYTDPKDIIARWGEEHPEAIKNTKKIADECDVEIELGKILIPKFPVPKGETEESYLQTLVYNGAYARYNLKKTLDLEKLLAKEEIIPKLSKDVNDRIEMELGIIASMGFNGYFLIVWDFIHWGKNRGIIFGPGRGSAAGSIIAYSIGVTDLDPLKYDLLFERFLNPDRISMPDIDVDIQDDRRDEVIQYCVEKYGDPRVANIVTFGKMAARSAAKDVARVLEVPYAESDRLSKMIPSLVQGRHVPISKSVKEDPDLKKEYNENPQSKQILDYAMRLEGTIRSHGVHACGVVIAPDDLVKYVPLERAQKGVVAAQFPMGQIEELGLLKMDFLGLSNLSIINNALRIIRKVYKKDIDISHLPLDDEKTYKLFQRGDTTGVFQLESDGMKKYLKELKPSAFEDIIAMVALYRPGPMQFIDSFIRRKHGEEEIKYLHSKMEPALKNTYGILVYQEQFMQISKELAGFTGGQADTLRKAVGKKKLDLMAKIKPQLIEGALANSDITKAKIELFWDQLEEFANYCFNKSHAACYALIAYWTAYLKAHYPSAFLASLMTASQNDTDRLAIMINDCRHSDIEVLAPNINESYSEFAIVPGTNKIRFGMAGVKGVGEAIVDEVIRIRDEGGKFKDITDFAKRMSGTKFNKKAWDSLARTGAFDDFISRDDLLYNLEKIQGYMSKNAKDAVSGQTDLFAMAGTEIKVPSIDIKPAKVVTTQREQLNWERELLGLYVSAHPLDKYERYLHENTVDLEEIGKAHDGKPMEIGGIISSVRQILTKKNDKMAFLTIENKLSQMSVVIFPRTYAEYEELLTVDKVIKINGRISAKDKEGNLSTPQMMANKIEEITDEMLQEFEPTFKKKHIPKGDYEYFLEENKAKKVGQKYQQKIKKQSKIEEESATNYKVIDPLEEAKKLMKKTEKNTSSTVLNKIKITKKVKPIKNKKPTLIKKTESKIKKEDKIIYLRIEDIDNEDLLTNIYKVCADFKGGAEVVLVLDGEKRSIIKLPYMVDSIKSLPIFEKMLSKDNVKIK